MTESLAPQHHAERVAHFRAQLLGPLLVGELERGELRHMLHELSQKRVRPPGSDVTRTYSVPTLERWYYRYKKGGVAALAPTPRKDRGAARALPEAMRTLLLDIRRAHPRASAELILRTLTLDGRLAKDALSPSAMRRLFAQHGLDRATLRRAGTTGRVRRRWEASAPGVLWHGDVCHGPTLALPSGKTPMRIHALLDDASRNILAIQVTDNERELEMLHLLVRALRRHPKPDALYLDNGSTYSGETLATACHRIDVGLLHAQPYDPQARGKMERFWRTLRAGCLDYLGDVSSLHDVQVRVLAFVEQHYRHAPHAGLMGRCPAQVWAEHQRTEALTDEALQKALTVRARRRVRGDGTLSIGGADWEAAQGFLAGRTVTIARALLETMSAPCLEHQVSSTRGRAMRCGWWTPSTTAGRRGARAARDRRAASTSPSIPPASCSTPPWVAPPLRRSPHDLRAPVAEALPSQYVAFQQGHRQRRPLAPLQSRGHRQPPRGRRARAPACSADRRARRRQDL